MKTPFFLIKKEELDKNIKSFQRALKSIWPNSNIGYSVKTNSLPWLLKYFKTQDIMAEVVSDEEYSLAVKCGFKSHEIVFNGPIKSKGLFLDSIEKNSIVNIDSKKELEFFRNNIYSSKSNVGVRINVDTSLFDSQDVDYQEEGFRFGFSEANGELKDAIDIVRLNNKNNKIGLHFHCNSITRSMDVYKKLAEYAKYIINEYEINPSFIDFGGGFFGGVEGKPSANDYITAIHDVLKDSVDINNTMLIVEPGSAIVGSAVDFHTSITDIKDTNKSRVVTTDGSRINIDPLWAKENYTYRAEKSRKNNKRKNIKKQIVCGYTCMDHDRIMSVSDIEEFLIDDKIIYEKVGAYTMTFGGPFIKYFPEVYVEANNNIELVRKKIDVNDYYNIHIK